MPASFSVMGRSLETATAKIFASYDDVFACYEG